MADTDDLNAEPAPEAVKPRGRTSLATVLLIVFNLLAVLGFGALMWMDYTKRIEWAVAIFLRDLAIVGLPLDEKDPAATKSAAVQSKIDLDPPVLRDAYKARGGSANDKFLAFNEAFNVRISYSDLDPTLVDRYFRDYGLSNPVLTVQKEFEQVKNKVPGQVSDVAQKVAEAAKAKNAAEKRNFLKKLLFPICTEAWQVVNLNKKIEKTPENALDDYVKEAAARRLWFDILKPLEVFRPSEIADAQAKEPTPDPLVTDRAAEVEIIDEKGRITYKETIKLEDMEQRFRKRCDEFLADRDWADPSLSRGIGEKRRCIAFLFVTLSQVEEPGAARAAAPKKMEKQGEPPADPQAGGGSRALAFPQTEDRAAAVCGLRDFNQACEDLTLVFEIMERNAVEAVERDRGQFIYPLTVRIADPSKFAEQLIARMQDMKIVIPDAKAFSKGIADRLREMQGKGPEQGIRLAHPEDSELLLGELQRIMDAHGVKVPVTPSPEVNKTALDREVFTLLNANAVGFLGKYSLMIKRIQDLAILIQRREQHYQELKSLQDEHNSLLKTRTEHEQAILRMMVDARTETRRLALNLQELQQQLFLAQVDLAGAHAYNLYLQQRLREVEQQKAKTKESKGQ